VAGSITEWDGLEAVMDISRKPGYIRGLIYAKADTPIEGCRLLLLQK
jgi:hypothetical protein